MRVMVCKEVMVSPSQRWKRILATARALLLFFDNRLRTKRCNSGTRVAMSLAYRGKPSQLNVRAESKSAKVIDAPPQS